MPGYSPGIWKAFDTCNENGETKCMTRENLLYDLKVLGKLESVGSVSIINRRKRPNIHEGMIFRWKYLHFVSRIQKWKMWHLASMNHSMLSSRMK